MVGRLSTTGILLQNVHTIRNNQTQYNERQLANATGEKYQQLKFYGSKAARIVNLESEIEGHAAYRSSIGLAKPFLDTYATALNDLADSATQLIRAADFSAVDTEDQDDFDVFMRDVNAIATAQMVRMEENLNLRIADRYIFAGSEFRQPPVVDIRELDVYGANDVHDTDEDSGEFETPRQGRGGSAAVAATAERPPVPPVPENPVPYFVVGRNPFDPLNPDAPREGTAQSYLRTFDPVNTPDANPANGPITNSDDDLWHRSQLTISDNLSLTYGITAANPAFQLLVEAAVRLRSAAQDELGFEARRDYLIQAGKLASDARLAIRQLEAENGSNLGILNDASELHKNVITISQNTLSNITYADKDTAAVELAALNRQIRASFQTMAQQNRQRLLDYI